MSIAATALRGPNVYYARDYGAAIDDTTNDTVALQALITAAGSNSMIVLNPGAYKMTTGPVTITGQNIVIYAYGATIDCGGGDGFHLTGNDQASVQLLGLHMKNFVPVGFGIPNNGSQDTVLKKNITVKDCKFTDSTTAGQYLIGVKLSCETYGVKLINNHVENLISTSTASGGWVYGMIVGRKADSLSGSRPGELGSYGYNGTITNAEGSTIISGNTVRRLRGSGGTNTDAVTGILADGWRCVVSNNVVEDIQYVGAGDNTASGTGIYFRGFDAVISGNALADCTTDQITVKQSSSATYGDTSQVVITGNTFRTLTTLSHSALTAAKIVGIYAPNVLVTGNYFSRCVVGRTASYAAIVWSTATTNDGVVISNNVFDRCKSDYVAIISGSNQTVTGNEVTNPIGTYAGTTSWAFVSYYCGATSSNVNISNNTVSINESLFGAGSATCYGVIVNTDAALYGLAIRDNRFLGWGAANPAENWNLINFGGLNVNTHEAWDIRGNSTDSAYRGILNYMNVSIGTATVYPSPWRFHWDFIGPVTASAAGAGITITADESGAAFANVGAAAAWQYALPAATPGLEFGFSKVVAQAMTVAPSGSEIINAGSAGGTLTLTNVGSSVHLKCFVAGTWIATASNGTYTVA